MIRYGSVCSGIEAATVAWHQLGWRPQFFSEIEAAPRAVLLNHYPDVPLHGDFTTIKEGEYGAIDLLVGGTPCQSFSVAGLRGGLADDRGNLALEYLRLAQRLRPRWLVWENVPGVLSSWSGPKPPSDLEEGQEWEAHETSDFGCFLSGMVELGYGFAYRVLDAQYVRVDGFGRAVPQRRRRVFVVGYLGDWRRAAAVLFERASLSGYPTPRRSAGAEIAGCLASRAGGGGRPDGGDGRHSQLVAQTLRARDQAKGVDSDCTDTLVAHSLRGEGFDASEDGTGRGTPIVPVAFGGNDTRGPISVATAVNAHGGPCGRMDFESETFIAFNSRQDPDVTWDRSGSLLAASDQAEAIAIRTNQSGQNGPGYMNGISFALSSEEQPPAVGIGHNSRSSMWSVRRLTPLECERLQGFPDGYTAVPWRGGILSDGPRYKALGNSMAVNVMRWIGRRIEMVEAL